MSLSAPKVMSNLPRVSALASAASRSTVMVSWLTGTGVMPAFLFIRTTSLPSFQTLSRSSRRSNSLNTCSNVSTAFASSLAHAVSVSCDPIDTRERSISLGRVILSGTTRSKRCED